MVKAMACDAQLSPLALRVGILLATGFNPDWGCAIWSYDRLAEKLDATKSGVIRAARTLEGRYFHVEKSSGGGRSNANRYTPINPDETVTAPSPIDDAERVTASSRKGDRTVTKRVTASSPERKELKGREREGAKIAPVPPPEFLKFEEIYAKPAGDNFGSRTKAIQAFREICESGVSPIRIIEGTCRWASTHAKKGDKATFALGAARFLREWVWKTPEPRWADFWVNIVEADPGDDRRDVWVDIWRKTFGGPLPGEPGSVFPPELIPAAERDAA